MWECKDLEKSAVSPLQPLKSRDWCLKNAIMAENKTPQETQDTKEFPSTLIFFEANGKPRRGKNSKYDLWCDVFVNTCTNGVKLLEYCCTELKEKNTPGWQRAIKNIALFFFIVLYFLCLKNQTANMWITKPPSLLELNHKAPCISIFKSLLDKHHVAYKKLTAEL